MTTTTFVQGVTASILAWRDANFPTLQIVTENQPNIDEASMSPIWLDLEFRWYGGSEIGVGQRNVTRHTGTVSCQVYVKEGEGIANSGAIVDSLSHAFRSSRQSGGLLRASQRSVPTTFMGWYKTGLFFPFQLDE